MPDLDQAIDSLTAVIGRLDRAEVAIIATAAEHKPNSYEAIRLSGKAAGVVMALGYARAELFRLKAASAR